MSRIIYIPLLVMLLLTTCLYGQIAEVVKDVHFIRGQELFDAGQYDAAVTEFRRSQQSDLPKGEFDRMRIDYYIAECEVLSGGRNAQELVEAFMEEYPGSPFTNDLRFSKANMLHAAGNFSEAVDEYSAVSGFDLSTSRQDEYNFNYGHSLFMTDRYQEASSKLSTVDRRSIYGVHAKYYNTYIEYVSGNYGVAKQGFTELANEPAYQVIIPFYLLQIEYLEGNYDYVTANGDRLMNMATGKRVAEIARIIAESWFHKADYEATLKYMDVYRTHAGEMGRDENYLVGYSMYMRNDISDAIAYLSQAVGPDDKLTQNAAYHLGGAYLSAGDKFKAMQSFSMASGASYDEAIREDALFNYGKLQYELGGGVFNEAINVLNRYIREYPNSSRVNQAREFLIAAYYNSKNYEAAYDAIKLIPDPDNNIRTAYQKIAYFRALEFYSEGDLDRAYRTLEEALNNRFNPKYTALTQFWMAEILYQRGEYTKAASLYRDYLALAPATEKEYAMAQYNLGYTYFNQEKWPDARTWFTRFLASYRSQDNFRADAFNRVGDTYYAGREFSKAIENYDQASRLGTSERYYAKYQRALALGLSAGQARKAEALRDIITSGEGSYIPDAVFELGNTYIAMERFSDGARELRDFISKYPSSSKYPAALSNLGLAYQNMNDNKTALTYYKTLVQKAPNSAESRDAMLAVKSIYVDMNDVDGYFAFAAGAGIETDTGTVARDSLTYTAAERLYMTGNRMPDAKKAFNDYVEKFPRGVYRANALFNLSDIYINEGNQAEAVDVLKRLSDLSYNQFTVRGLERLSKLAFDNRMYYDAAEAYEKLAVTAVNPQTVETAWTGYLKSIAVTGGDDILLAAADKVINANATGTALEQARLMKANQLYKRGDRPQAQQLYERVAANPSTEAGAEATYYLIEIAYINGGIDRAEKMVLDFSATNTQHMFWLGKAFLILGDIYISKGDSFQARATLQSIIDGYPNDNDGVMTAAREKIATLGN